MRTIKIQAKYKERSGNLRKLQFVSMNPHFWKPSLDLRIPKHLFSDPLQRTITVTVRIK